MQSAASAVIEFFERTGRRPIVVASYPRSGTHLLIDSLRLNFAECESRKRLGERHEALYLSLDALAALSPREAVRRVTSARRPVLKTHAMPDFSACGRAVDRHPYDPALVEWLRRCACWLYTYRDPRECLNSLHAMTRSETGDRRTSLAEFIRQTERGWVRPALWAHHVSGWMAGSFVYGLAMEELLASPGPTLSGIAEWCGLELPARGKWQLPARHGSVLASRIARMFRRRPASSEVGPGIRRDGHWRTLLSIDDRRFMLRHLGDLLIKLGYEDSDNWVNCAAENEPKYPAGVWADASHLQTHTPPKSSRYVAN